MLLIIIQNIEPSLSKKTIYYQSMAAFRVPRSACLFLSGPLSLSMKIEEDFIIGVRDIPN